MNTRTALRTLRTGLLFAAAVCLASLSTAAATITVDNVASLGTTRAGDGDIAETRGYSVRGVGAARYVYHLTGRTTHAEDGVLYFDGVGADGYWELLHNGTIDVTQAGAVGSGNETSKLQLAATAAGGGKLTISIPVTCSLAFGDSIVVPSGTALEFIGDGKITAQLADESEYAPLFYLNGKSNVHFIRPVIEWTSTYLENDGDNAKYGLGLSDDYFHGIWFIYGCDNVSIISPKTYGTDDTASYNHGVFLHSSSNVLMRNVDASHYGSWLFAWNAEANPEYCLIGGRFSKQSLKTNLFYGPGHAIYSFAAKSVIRDIVDDGTTVGYSEDIQSADDVADTITVATGKFINGNEVTVDSTGGGLTAGVLYYVVNAAGSTLQLSQTKGGSAVDITSDISGVSLSLSDTMAGHTIKIRHNSPSNDTDQVVVSGVSSLMNTGVLDIVDEVRNSTFSDISWARKDSSGNYSSTYLGAFLLQGTTTLKGPVSCTFENIKLECSDTDMPLIYMRATRCVVDARITCESDVSFEHHVINLSYAFSCDIDVEYTEYATDVANQRPLLEFDRNCQGNGIRIKLRPDWLYATARYGGVVSFVGNSSSSMTSFAKNNFITLHGSPEWQSGQLEYIYYDNSLAMSDADARKVYEANDLIAGARLVRTATPGNPGDTTPNVQFCDVLLFANTGATTVTAFDGGVNGQYLEVHVDANTTISDSGGTIDLDTALGGSFAGGSGGGIITFRRIGGVWKQVGPVVNF